MTKKEQAAIRLGIINRVFSAVMHKLEDSHIYGTDIWPEKGFKAGTYPDLNRLGNYKMDTICIGVRVDIDTTWKAVRFNIWSKTYGRGFKQYLQLLRLFDKAIFEDILFEAENPDLDDRMPAHFHEDCVMGMLTVKFTIQQNS